MKQQPFSIYYEKFRLVSNFQFLFSESGGAGRIRTADKQFRKLLLYPSELQPRSSIVILPGLFRSVCVCQSGGRAAPGAVSTGFDFAPGALLVIRRLRKIVGQYSRTALLAAFRPIRTPYRRKVRPAVCSFTGR